MVLHRPFEPTRTNGHYQTNGRHLTAVLVSNDAVGRFRSLRKFLSALALSLCTVLFLTWLASRIEQHFFRRRAELLLSQVQSLELRRTPWQDAQIQLQRWGPNRVMGDSCDAHICSFQVTLDEFVFAHFIQRNPLVRLDDYFRWRLKLSYNTGPFERMEYALLQAYVRLGGHPARVTANIRMRDGTVWGKDFSVWIESYGHPVSWSGNWRSEFTLIASAYSVSRFEHFFGPIDLQLMLHPYYSIGRPSGCTICVEGWAIFTPYAAPSDVYRLMQMDLSCLTRWRPCLTQSDIMPVAWAQYLAERPHLYGSSGALPCSSSFLEILGRDSANIAIVEVLKHQHKVDHQSDDSELANVRLLKRLKGVGDWDVGETREVRLWGGRDESMKLPVGRQLILFRRWGPSTETWTISVPSCPITWVNDTNLTLIRRGIDQDYSALDKSN
jgi:hypothetical protein